MAVKQVTVRSCDKCGRDERKTAILCMPVKGTFGEVTIDLCLGHYRTLMENMVASVLISNEHERKLGEIALALSGHVETSTLACLVQSFGGNVPHPGGRAFERESAAVVRSPFDPAPEDTGR